jgi:hypothetical protein
VEPLLGEPLLGETSLGETSLGETALYLMYDIMYAIPFDLDLGHGLMLSKFIVRNCQDPLELFRIKSRMYICRLARI